MNQIFDLVFMFRGQRFWLIALLIVGQLRGELVSWRTIPPEGMTKAELHYERDLPAIHGVMVLLPGMNGDGLKLAQDAAWRSFAKENGLGLVGVSFSSSPELLYGDPARGYYYPEQGSGEVLIRGMHELYGKDVKLFLYGFSGGAQFSARFADQHPERVLSWAAYAACFWADSVAAAPSGPPGIVTCGEFDAERYGPAFGYFQQGRRKEARWTWVSVGNIGHVRYRRLEDFIRAYFAAILAGDFTKESWMDAELKQPTSEDERLLTPSLSVWLPTPQVADSWLKLHHP
jgi:pimeloyl-ACP methyl ester carboxylesterase